MIQETPLFWPAHIKNGVLYVLDETLIPSKVSYVKVRNVHDAVDVIREMKTRAFGQFLVVLSTFLIELKNSKMSDQELSKHLINVAELLNHSRPTFPFSEVTSIVNHWAQKAVAENLDLRKYVEKNIQGYLMGIRQRRMERVAQIAKVIKNADSVLTHCNVSGELAMAAAICQSEGKNVHYFATETRPYFQGSKLTAWELKKVGAKVTIIADNAVAHVIAEGLVNKIIVGSDRSCANGDFANKIGTYQIAMVAKAYKIPFYVLTQPSNKIKKGSDIPIELRHQDELLIFNGQKVFKDCSHAYYPGFDVIPHQLVTDRIAIQVN